MKNAIMGCMLFLSSILFILMFSIQYTESIKIQELNELANISIGNAIVELNNNPNCSEAKLKDIVFQSAKKRYQSDGELLVDILVLDIDNGIISAKYTSKWQQANMKNRKMEVKRTMMIDQLKEH
ncbi:MAG: hypothetical protein RR945_01480 [Erysipelotrichaceae bacterium]